MKLSTTSPVAGETDAGSTAPALPHRLRRERRTVQVMIRMYCREHHGAAVGAVPGGASSEAGLCPACAALLAYSDRRVAVCRFGPDKPTCAHCTVHCFRISEREQVRAVMRYAGPRMTLRHPYLAVLHLLDRRRTPGQPRRGAHTV